MATPFGHKTAIVTMRALDEKTIFIHGLHSRNGTQLHTTELMKELIEHCDNLAFSLQVDVRACVNPPETPIGEFIVFYEELGFERIEGATMYLMERSPSWFAGKT